jgi:hypothetical protein
MIDWVKQLFGRFEIKSDNSFKNVAQNEYRVTLDLNHKIQPIDRGDLYEDPLDEMLKSSGNGYVDGGGSYLMSDSNEISCVSITVVVTQEIDITIQSIINFIEKRGAPRGSSLSISGKTEIIAFGTKEGLGLYLNAFDLPDDTYKNNDVNVVITDLNKLLGESGRFKDFWEGQKEVGMFAYGHSFVEMNKIIAEYVRLHPLCQKSRIVQIA